VQYNSVQRKVFKKMKFIIKTDDDKLRLYNYLKQLQDKDYVVEIKEQKNNRSLNQNAYYWRCIVQVMADDLGYFSDEMHEILKAKFLSEYQILEHQDKKAGVLYVQSTSRLNTKEFEMYVEKVRIWASTELNINLMLPNEY